MRRFGAKMVESHGLTWFNTQKEAKYALENWMDENRLALEFPAIRNRIRELGVGYVFNESERCNLTWSWVVIASMVMLTWKREIL
ncbi:hypothetical protein HAX54_031277 [Datura stramonium]|uniref:Uncharacterized protein n=1 Tax=Datura stramonium TaxID=4076 RepID=A0ABS8SCM4_DATST|nr:hypothetical protein [Datura stramonium]